MGVGVIIPAPVGVRNPDDQGIDALRAARIAARSLSRMFRDRVTASQMDGT
jgi:hypothetical protein